MNHYLLRGIGKPYSRMEIKSSVQDIGGSFGGPFITGTPFLCLRKVVKALLWGNLEVVADNWNK
jgi:hypothetical protein